jgi:hypothetical protein
MMINLQRVIVAATSLIIIGLVVIIVLQYRRIENFMNIDKNTDLFGKTISEMEKKYASSCEAECKKNPACTAAVIKDDGTCLLKSTIGEQIQDATSAAIRYPCELYDDIEFRGKGITIDIGRYNLSDLQKKGYSDKSLKSIKLRDGYKITVYDKNGFSGNDVSFTTSQPDLSVIIRDPRPEPTIKWDKAVSSIILQRV